MLMQQIQSEPLKVSCQGIKLTENHNIQQLVRDQLAILSNQNLESEVRTDKIVHI